MTGTKCQDPGALQYRTERFRRLDWNAGLLGVSVQESRGGMRGGYYPLTSRRRLQWYRCWTKVASRAEHPVLRHWAFDESSLSSATTSGLLVGLREKKNGINLAPQEHTSPGHQSLFLLSSSHPEWKNNTKKTQTIGKLMENKAVTSNE